MRRAFAILATTIALCDLVSSCKEPTQITLEIRTDVRCGGSNPRLEWTEISIGASNGNVDGSSPVARVPSNDKPACIDGYVGKLVLVPSGRGERIQVRVAAHVKLDVSPPDATPKCVGSTIGGDCLVARRVASFVRQSSLTLPIFLSSACLGKTCPADETCVQGACRPADCETNPSLCMSSMMDAGSGDATIPVDAGTDGGSECKVDGDCKLFPSTCDGIKLKLCVCYPLLKNQADPVCDGLDSTCLVDPCMDKTARCIMGTCTVE